MSLVLHLFLLWPATSTDRPGQSAQPLSVALRSEKAASPVVAPPPPSAPAAPRSERPKPPLAGEDSPHPPPGPSDPPSANTLASTAEIPRRSDGQPNGMAAAAGEAPPQPAAGLDADGVRQYRMALAVEARRFKRYPRSALADEVGGTVEVRVAVAAGGQAQEVAVARSSGYGALDDAALEMMRKAAPRTAVPELLRRRSFVINLPVVFDVASE